MMERFCLKFNWEIFVFLDVRCRLAGLFLKWVQTTENLLLEDFHGLENRIFIQDIS